MTVLALEDARHEVEKHAWTVSALNSESVDLLQATGRILAKPVKADRDLPPFPRATRDGFAVRAADVTDPPSRLKVIAEIAAGANVGNLTLKKGECAEIMTGAAVPAGADAVVMVEYTSGNGSEVEIHRNVESGENVVPRGAEAQEGQLLLEPGTRLNPAAIATCASVGLANVEVFQKAQVAILSTGDELVDLTTRPLDHQIRNSNSFSLAAQVMRTGATPVLLPIARDEKTRLRALVEQGLNCDLLLLTGGVSMGKYDLVEIVLQELGAEFIFTGAKIQPGKPVVFGKVTWRGKAKYFFGLPGNPVSTMVTFELFARPMIEALSGSTAMPLRYDSARLRSEIKTKTGLTRFLPAILTGEFESQEVELVRWQGSGDMVSTARANCLAVIPPDREKIEAGEVLSLLRL